MISHCICQSNCLVGWSCLQKTVSSSDLDVHEQHYAGFWQSWKSECQCWGRRKASTSLAFKAAFCSIKQHEEWADTISRPWLQRGVFSNSLFHLSKYDPLWPLRFTPLLSSSAQSRTQRSFRNTVNIPPSERLPRAHPPPRFGLRGSDLEAGKIFFL